MNEKDDFIFFGYHVVCLIDVLGQKDKLAQWANLPTDGQLTPELEAALKQTAGTVLTFRDRFIEFFQQLGECAMPEKIAALPADQQERYQRLKECRVKVQRFADTFVFSSVIPNAYGDASVIPLYRILSACCMAMLWSLAAETPVRGAVSIGAGAELDDESFYGPGLAEAHHLESEVSGYPRVIVSETVRRFLADGQTYSNDLQTDQTMRRMADICRSFISQDADGCWIVDFLGDGLRGLTEPDTELPSAVRAAYEFVRNEADRFRRTSDTKHALRYYLLQQYIESRLPIWGIQTDD